jgi:hypothetical protein
MMGVEDDSDICERETIRRMVLLLTAGVAIFLVGGAAAWAPSLVRIVPAPTHLRVASATTAYVTLVWRGTRREHVFGLWRDHRFVTLVDRTRYRFGPLRCGTQHTFAVVAHTTRMTRSRPTRLVARTTACLTPTPHNTSPPSISGTPQVVSTLAVSHGTWLYASSYAFQWLRCTSVLTCTPISGATSSTYRVQAADAGLMLGVAVTASGAGGASTASAAPVAVATGAGPPLSCDLLASPAGSDANSGTIASPFRSAQQLVDSLTPGETGCLAPGVYAEDVTVRAAGTATAPITVTSENPSMPATIIGHFYVHQGADYTTFTNLYFDQHQTVNIPSPIVDANHVTFSYDDVTNDNTQAICFMVGSTAGYGPGDNFLADHDVVHNCGDLNTRTNQAGDPNTGFYEHAFYMENTTDFRIANTIMYGISNRCVQLYPHAVYGMIDHNVCDGSGTGVIVDSTSQGNVITKNIICNTVVQGALAEGSVLSTGGNVASDNVMWGNSIDLYQIRNSLFTVTGTVYADPMFADAANHDYRLSPLSSAVGYGPDSIQP